MRAAALVALIAATGCLPSGSADPSSAVPSPSDSVGGIGLPPDCEPIDLRDPTGARIDLTGEWEGTDVMIGPEEQVWLHQIGDCLYGSVYAVELSGTAEAETFVVDLGGRLADDFTIDVEVVFVHQDTFLEYVPYSTVRMVIEWDSDGLIRLREERAVNERPGRCNAQIEQINCPRPVIWYRAGEAPPT